MRKNNENKTYLIGFVEESDPLLRMDPRLSSAAIRLVARWSLV